MEKPKAREFFKIEYPNTPAGKKDWNKRFSDNAYYAGKHWAVRKKDADYWHNMVRACMDRQGVRKRPFEKPVVITVYFNDRLDCSNHSIMFKMIEDGMKGRLIRDDSRKWVKGTEMYLHDEDYIKVAVREIEEGENRGKAGK